MSGKQAGNSFLSFDHTSVATFIKTDSPQVVEVLGLCDLDYVILDAEHAPFDRNCMDRMLLAARAVQLPMLVRIPNHEDSTILSVLDMGAAGIVVPHVDSAADALNVMSAARYKGGRRSFSGSPRFGGYGTYSVRDTVAMGDSSMIVCQIESSEAVADVEQIAQIPGIAALFVGRADLAVSLGSENWQSPEVMAGVEKTIKAANAHALPVILTVEQEPDLGKFRALGAKSFVFGSDQSLLRRAASRLRGLLADPIQ